MMKVVKSVLFGMFVVGIIIIIIIFTGYLTQEKNVVFECLPEFWRNNLDLWKVVGVDYNADFDKTFGTDYFEPNITLEQAIKKEGVGMDRIASVGTAAYLDALLDPKIDEETVRKSVYFGYIHQLDNYIANCNQTTKIIPGLTSH